MTISKMQAIADKIQAVIQLDPQSEQNVRQQARAAVLDYGPEGYYQRFMQMLEQVGARRRRLSAPRTPSPRPQW